MVGGAGECRALNLCIKHVHLTCAFYVNLRQCGCGLCSASGRLRKTPINPAFSAALFAMAINDWCILFTRE